MNLPTRWKPSPYPPKSGGTRSSSPGVGGDSLFLPPGLGGWGAEALFRDGLCLPSGTAMSETDLTCVAAAVCSLRG